MENRDKEIDRLGQLLEGGRPVHAIMKDTKQDSSDKVVAHLNVQVTFMTNDIKVRRYSIC